MPTARLRSHARSLAICFLVFVFAVRKTLSAQSPSGSRFSDDEVRQRADLLLKQMTLEEKIGQLSQLFVFQPTKDRDEAVSKGQLGSLLFVTDPADINRYQHLATEKSRLHIPLIFGFDVIHGFRTIFPVPIAMAASWDPALVTEAQTIAAKEARSVGIDWAFAPMLDIARDPRWGRINQRFPLAGTSFRSM
jgi:beta-glucosidase